ncbi:hypothetical protein GWK08_19005 [Leptobacterium flavescens]|uniref:Phytanoyl-CoA dioxygenase n=1 Tax=Leptobacterium flavescens TaxID=472055 RepID=A0A6P0UQC5_9FLAO|nr:hypothetical protein [Leptobacterium flavescens]NER15551.1 hypothetical protein [Leptobacterium flavescens]
MEISALHQKLDVVTAVILGPEDDFSSLEQAVMDLKELFMEASRLNPEAQINKENLLLNTGVAIGPKWAGMCVDDVKRTKRFISGLDKAIQEVRSSKTKGPVHIMYTGTGPFATLVWPLLSKYTPEELQLVLLEVNTVSISSLKHLIKAFNAYDYIKEIYHCDASNFEYTSFNEDIDIVLIECLQHALMREPQVAITYNLLPQLRKDVILIPEEISLNVSLIDMDKKGEYEETGNEEYSDFLEEVDCVFRLDKQTVAGRSALNRQEVFNFDRREVVLEEDKLDRNDLLAITTDIKIFKDEQLHTYDSGLTAPLILADLNNAQKMKGVQTQYIVSNQPGIVSSIIR